MRLHELKPAKGANHDRKRLGRGNASGQGTTAGRGTKGQKARAGGFRAGFRGMSSRNQRLAKRRGFNNIFKITYQVVNIEDLAAFEAGIIVDGALLKQAGLIAKAGGHIKILGDGEIAGALHLVGVKASSSARQKIEAAGGSIQGQKATAPEEATGATSST